METSKGELANRHQGIHQGDDEEADDGRDADDRDRPDQADEPIAAEAPGRGSPR